jgi:hypothetical protein
MPTLRDRFSTALAGDPIDEPIYAAYDWFILHRPMDWESLIQQGLGIIGHADLLSVERPHVQITETITETDRGTRRDVHWVTDIGELHEWYLGEWRQEYLIKTPADYHVMARALSNQHACLAPEKYRQLDDWVGERGVTLGTLNRTPLQEVQIDMAGLERFSLDFADERPELMELLELMTEQFLDGVRLAAGGPATHIKLWENLSIETMGPANYRRFLVPLYHRIFDILTPASKRLVVHYDGKLRIIADQIAALDFGGIDSFTQPPEGDMSVAEARACWPDKFLWVQPNLGWYSLPEEEFLTRVRRLAHDAGPRRYCLMISEEVPPDWQRTVPAVLRMLTGKD